MPQNKITKVTDIIDLEYLQKIQDSLGRIAGITTELLDPDGDALTDPTNLHAFCAMMQASEQGSALCKKTKKELIKKNRGTKGSAVVSCPHSGLQTASVPIFLDEEYLGSWLIGQVRVEDINEELIEETAEQAGISKDEAKAHIKLLPVVSQKEFLNVLTFLETITETITNLVKMSDQLNKQNEDLVALSGRLDDSFKTFRDFISLTDLGAYVVDYDTGKLIMCNESFRNTFMLEEDEVTGLTCYNCMGYDEPCSFCPKDNLIEESGEVRLDSYVWEYFNEKTGHWFIVNSRGLRWVDGRVVVMTTFSDITDRKEEEKRIAYLAYNDQRLEIPNDVKLADDLKQADQNTYMICFDIQGLRKINDIYSRDVGDDLLRAIVGWIKGLDLPGGSLYRIEGDDFAILLSSSSEAAAMKFASQIQERFESAWHVEMSGIQQNLYAGVHMGVIAINQPIEDQSAMLNMVERVLSFARKEGRLIFFDEKMNQEIENNMQLELRLKHCVLNDMEGFTLNYQPIVQAATGQWVGLEALCRWTDDELGIIPPDIFIQQAEQLGLIGIISDWVMEEAISQVKTWKLDELPFFVLDINLSPLQLEDRTLLPKTLELLQKYNYPPQRLSLEITETAEVSFDEKTIALLNEIRSSGISLSLDDFGSGYATFSNLKNLPVDNLKTDRSFMTGIEEDDFLQYTTRIMFDFAKAAGMSTIAEGVETELQRDIMQKNGVNMIQGYYFSKPLAKEELAKKLAEFNGTN